MSSLNESPTWSQRSVAIPQDHLDEEELVTLVELSVEEGQLAADERE